MTEQVAIDFDAARKERDDAIARAVSHANAVSPKWSVLAYEFVVAYAQQVETFTSEEVRGASSNIVPPPPELRAWGGVFMRAAKSKMLSRTGFEPAKDPKVHCNMVTRWKSNLYTGVRND